MMGLIGRIWKHCKVCKVTGTNYTETKTNHAIVCIVYGQINECSSAKKKKSVCVHCAVSGMTCLC